MESKEAIKNTGYTFKIFILFYIPFWFIWNLDLFDYLFISIEFDASNYDGNKFLNLKFWVGELNDKFEML